MLSEQRRKARAALASAHAGATRRPDDPELQELIETRRRDYRFVTAEDYIRRVVAEAPPLTPAQLDRLALLLGGSSSGRAA